MNYDDILEELKKFEQPHEIGAVLTRHILDKYPIEKRVEVVRSILKTLMVDFFTYELPDGEVERIRNIIDKI